MKKNPIERKWYLCPKCGAKMMIYDNMAESHGVFTICSRGCRNEVEILIQDGKQVFPEHSDAGNHLKM